MCVCVCVYGLSQIDAASVDATAVNVLEESDSRKVCMYVCMYECLYVCAYLHVCLDIK